MTGSPAKYLGMAAQDFYLFETHSLITSAVGKTLHDDQITGTMMMDNLYHSIALSLAFPAIRKIGGGGQFDLRQGRELFKHSRGLATFGKQYNRTDYRKMMDSPEGEKTGRGLLMLLTKGADMNVKNSNIYQGIAKWSVNTVKGKKTYTPGMIEQGALNPSQIPKEHVISLLEQYRGVANKAFKEWGFGYLKEMANAGQITRMVLGSAVMNIDFFKDGYYKKMPGPELFQHLVVGALMTKGRGLWNNPETSQWAKKYNKYHEVFSYLNMDHKPLSHMVKSYTEAQHLGEIYGVAFKTHEVGAQIFDVIDKPGKNGNDQIHSDYGKVDYIAFQRVSEFVRLYNSMKMGENPAAPGIDPKRLSAKRIEEIFGKLNEIKIPDGTTLETRDLFDVVAMTTAEVGSANRTMYMEYLDELSKKIGLPVIVERDPNNKPTGRLTYYETELNTMVDYSIGGKYEFTIGKVLDTIRFLDSMGLAKPVSNPDMSQKYVVVGKKGKEKVVRVGDDKPRDIGGIIENITERYMGNIVRSIHGKNDAMRFNFLSIEDNPYIQSILTGYAAEVKERAFRLATGETTEGPLKSAEQDFIKLTDLFFKINDNMKGAPGVQFNGRYLKSAPIIIPDKPSKDLKAVSYTHLTLPTKRIV